ncbi:MAG: hypothetical protein ACFFD4_32115 [Candidatus Odinarchaeota archaeon]
METKDYKGYWEGFGFDDSPFLSYWTELDTRPNPAKLLQSIGWLQGCRQDGQTAAKNPLSCKKRAWNRDDAVTRTVFLLLPGSCYCSTVYRDPVIPGSFCRHVIKPGYSLPVRSTGTVSLSGHA